MGGVKGRARQCPGGGMKRIADHLERENAEAREKSREAFHSVEWPAHVAFLDTTDEWEKRMKERKFG